MAASDDRLDRLEALIEKTSETQRNSEVTQRNNEAIDRLTADLNQLTVDVKRWDERCFQLSRGNLIIARAIITAGTVVILSPVLQALALVIETVVSRLLGPGQ